MTLYHYVRDKRELLSLWTTPRGARRRRRSSRDGGHARVRPGRPGALRAWPGHAARRRRPAPLARL